MQTIIKGKSSQVTISTEGPVTIIGESINPTRRKKLNEALVSQEFDYLFELASTQIENGADILDINVGSPEVDEVALLVKVSQAIIERFDVPICLDSSNPDALASALSALPGKPLINSVTGEKQSLRAVLPIVKEYGAAVIGLTMDDAGISHDPDIRLRIAGTILEHATRVGIPIEDVIIDPLVMAVSADETAGLVTLKTIELLRKKFGVNINLGASNVSFGLPDRNIVNQSFLALAIHAGASCIITNSEKLTPAVRAADLLLGRDPRSKRYIANYRQRLARDKNAHANLN